MDSNFRIKLIVGLGNPGKEYENTRHNVGFVIVDKVSEALFNDFSYKNKYSGKFGVGISGGSKLFILKPLTYMNLSGNSVYSAVSMNNIRPEEILVIHDDLDTEVGRIKIKFAGGSGGHNGIKSITERLGSNLFCRLKIGIGRDSSVVSSDYVLSAFNSQEKEIIKESIEKTIEIVKLIIASGISVAMNTYNAKTSSIKIQGVKN